MLVDFEYKTTVTCRVKIPAELRKDFTKLGTPGTPDKVAWFIDRAKQQGMNDVAAFLTELEPKLFDTDILMLLLA